MRELPKDVLKMASGLISPSGLAGHCGQLCIGTLPQNEFHGIMNILHNSRNIFVAGCGYQTPISHRAAWRPGGRGELVPAISCCYHPVTACEVTTTGPSIPPPLTTSVVTAVVSTGQHSHHHLQLSHDFLEGSLTVLVVSCFGFCFVNIHVSLSATRLYE